MVDLMIGFVSDNFAVLIGIFFMLIILANDISLDKEKKRIFYLGYLICIIELCADMLESQAALSTTYSIYRVLWSAISYSLRPMLIYLLILLGQRSKKNKYVQLCLLLPAIINAGVAFSAMFCDVCFSYTADNYFQQGPLGHVPAITLVFYLVVVVVYEIIVSYKEYPYQIINVSLCVFICMVALIIQINTGNASVGRVARVYALMCYYMFFQSKQFRIQNAKEKFKSEHDALTEIYNRAAFQRYTDEFQMNKIPLLLVMVDVDKFKKINDNFGHEVGDHTLKKVADFMKSSFRESDLIFRVGGDEFAIMSTFPSEKFMKIELAKKIDMINQELKKTSGDAPPVTISAGASFSSSGYSNKLFEEADSALYCAKRNGQSGFSFF